MLHMPLLTVSLMIFLLNMIQISSIQPINISLLNGHTTADIENRDAWFSKHLLKGQVSIPKTS